MSKHFNNKVRFTQITVRREEKEGRLLVKESPYETVYTNVDAYEDNLIHLVNGSSISVQEDCDQIREILDKKEAEAEAYNDRQRSQDRTAFTPVGDD